MLSSLTPVAEPAATVVTVRKARTKWWLEPVTVREILAADTAAAAPSDSSVDATGS